MDSHSPMEECFSQFFNEQYPDEQPSHKSPSEAALKVEIQRLRTQVAILHDEANKLKQSIHQPSSAVSEWIHKVQQQANGAPEILQTLGDEPPPQNRHRSAELERWCMIVWFRYLIELVNNPPSPNPTSPQAQRVEPNLSISSTTIQEGPIQSPLVDEKLPLSVQHEYQPERKPQERDIALQELDHLQDDKLRLNGVAEAIQVAKERIQEQETKVDALEAPKLGNKRLQERLSAAHTRIAALEADLETTTFQLADAARQSPNMSPQTTPQISTQEQLDTLRSELKASRSHVDSVMSKLSSAYSTLKDISAERDSAVQQRDMTIWRVQDEQARLKKLDIRAIEDEQKEIAGRLIEAQDQREAVIQERDQLRKANAALKHKLMKQIKKTAVQATQLTWQIRNALGPASSESENPYISSETPSTSSQSSSIDSPTSPALPISPLIASPASPISPVLPPITSPISSVHGPAGSQDTAIPSTKVKAKSRKEKSVKKKIEEPPAGLRRSARANRNPNPDYTGDGAGRSSKAVTKGDPPGSNGGKTEKGGKRKAIDDGAGIRGGKRRR